MYFFLIRKHPQSKIWFYQLYFLTFLYISCRWFTAIKSSPDYHAKWNSRNGIITVTIFKKELHISKLFNALGKIIANWWISSSFSTTSPYPPTLHIWPATPYSILIIHIILWFICWLNCSLAWIKFRQFVLFCSLTYFFQLYWTLIDKFGQFILRVFTNYFIWVTHCEMNYSIGGDDTCLEEEFPKPFQKSPRKLQ